MRELSHAEDTTDHWYVEQPVLLFQSQKFYEE